MHAASRLEEPIPFKLSAFGFNLLAFYLSLSSNTANGNRSCEPDTTHEAVTPSFWESPS